MATVGDRLREWGVQQFGSVKNLAKALGMSPPGVQQYLSNKREPGMVVLRRLLNLGCNIEWLMTGNLGNALKRPPSIGMSDTEISRKHSAKSRRFIQGISKMPPEDVDILRKIAEDIFGKTRKTSKRKND